MQNTTLNIYADTTLNLKTCWRRKWRVEHQQTLATDTIRELGLSHRRTKKFSKNFEPNLDVLQPSSLRILAVAKISLTYVHLTTLKVHPYVLLSVQSTRRNDPLTVSHNNNNNSSNNLTDTTNHTPTKQNKKNYIGAGEAMVGRV